MKSAFRPQDVQYDMFAIAEPLNETSEVLSLMRPHKWATGEWDELELIRIELEPHEGRWMWSASLNSKNALTILPYASYGSVSGLNITLRACSGLNWGFTSIIACTWPAIREG